jgi:dTDP-4-amino-4,6-dideoxygalactose transaminase
MANNKLCHIAQAHVNGHLAGDGGFIKQRRAWLEAHTGVRKSLLLHLFTAAMGMSVLNAVEFIEVS